MSNAPAAAAAAAKADSPDAKDASGKIQFDKSMELLQECLSLQRTGKLPGLYFRRALFGNDVEICRGLPAQIPKAASALMKWCPKRQCYEILLDGNIFCRFPITETKGAMLALIKELCDDHSSKQATLKQTQCIAFYEECCALQKRLPDVFGALVFQLISNDELVSVYNVDGERIAYIESVIPDEGASCYDIQSVVDGEVVDTFMALSDAENALRYMLSVMQPVRDAHVAHYLTYEADAIVRVVEHGDVSFDAGEASAIENLIKRLQAALAKSESNRKASAVAK